MPSDCPSLRFVWLLAGLMACNSEGAGSGAASQAGSGGSVVPPLAAGSASQTGAAGSARQADAAAGAGGSAVAGSRAPDAGVIDAGASTGAAGAAGTTAGRAGAGAGMGAAGSSIAGAGGATAAGAGGAASTDLAAYAKDLDALFIDVPCAMDTPTPLAQMATCMHPANTQHIEKSVTFGGDSAKTYAVALRIRGIWEPTKIQSGEHPYKDQPFNVGGMLPPGTSSNDPISYQQYFVQVSAPKQTYWLNDHGYVAHDIHKVDYQATIQVSGGAKIIVTMNDGNDHEIANWTKDYFEGLPPYDTQPSLGQMLRLDVISVTAMP